VSQDDAEASNPSFLHVERLAKWIQEASSGRLIIDHNPAGAIVPEDTTMESAAKGMLDMGHTTPREGKPTLGPSAQLFDSHVAGPTMMEYFFWFRKGEGLDLMQELLAASNWNIVTPAVDIRLPETFLYTNFELTKPEDLDGKKLRLLGDEAEIFGKLGVAAVATPTAEVYQAVQQGVIDGLQRSGLYNDWTYGLHEIVDYAHVGSARQSTNTYGYFINGDSWAELPDDLKMIVESVLWNGATLYGAEQIALECEAAQQWIDYGVKVQVIPKSVEDAVVASAQEFYAEMEAKDPFYAKVRKSLLDWKNAVDTSFGKL
jgi:TRAP-type mannitol/chloroaromatic compound transport system substrate-binding protein